MQLHLGPTAQFIDKDDELLDSCGRINAIFGSEDTVAKEAAELVERTIATAGLTNTVIDELQEDSALSPRMIDGMNAAAGRLTAENRAFLIDRIGEFLRAMREEVNQSQARLVDSAFAVYSNIPLDARYGWHPRLLELRKLIVEQTRQGQNTKASADALATNCIEKRISTLRRKAMCSWKPLGGSDEPIPPP